MPIMFICHKIQPTLICCKSCYSFVEMKTQNGSRCKAWLRWRHNGHDSVSNHQPHDCLLNRLFRRRSKKTSKLRVTGLCVWNSPGTGEFPAQMASNAENVSIWWRHHGLALPVTQVNPILRANSKPFLSFLTCNIFPTLRQGLCQNI